MFKIQFLVPEKTLESPLDSKEIKPVNPKWNQLWILIGRTDAETEASTHWLPDVKSQRIRKDPNVGKIEGKRRRGWQKMRCLNSITNSMDKNLGKLQGVRDREGWHAAVHEVAKSWNWLRDWTTITCLKTTGLHDDVLLLSSLFYLFYFIFSAHVSFSSVFQFLCFVVVLFHGFIKQRRKVLCMYVRCCHSVAQWCLTVCDPTDCCMPGFPVHHHPQSLLKLMST